MMVRSRQAIRTDFMPRTRAPDGCGRGREPKSRVRHPLAFDWPVAARLKPTMSLTSWPINPWSRIWNLLTKPCNGDGDLGRCSRTHDSRSSASRADGEDASTSLASSTGRATPRSQITCQRPPTAIWCTHSASTTFWPTCSARAGVLRSAHLCAWTLRLGQSRSKAFMLAAFLGKCLEIGYLRPSHRIVPGHPVIRFLLAVGIRRRHSRARRYEAMAPVALRSDLRLVSDRAERELGDDGEGSGADGDVNH
jgi:hypothetical protein